MKRINTIIALKEVKKDLDRGESFYEIQESGIGKYFRDCIISDMESLYLYAGIHEKYLGTYKLLSKRFPYAVYYIIKDNTVIVVAVLDMRRNPSSINRQLKQRDF